MDTVGTGKRVRIYVGERDKAAGRHEPLWETILNFLRDEGAAGATAFRGLAGFGAHSKLHLARLADVIPDLPVLIEWIDGPARVERLRPGGRPKILIDNNEELPPAQLNARQIAAEFLRQGGVLQQHLAIPQHVVDGRAQGMANVAQLGLIARGRLAHGPGALCKWV